MWFVLGWEFSCVEFVVFVMVNSDIMLFDWVKDYFNVVVKLFFEKLDMLLFDSKVYIVDILNNVVLLY